MTRVGVNQSRNINGGKYYWQLQEWVNKLFMKYNECLICGEKEGLEPHHIIQVKPYDKLYSDVNNGAVLCKKCHRLYHETYKGDINPVTLTLFSQSQYKDNGDKRYRKLNKKYNQLKKVEKYYRNETFKLRDELGLTKNGYSKKEDLKEK